MLKHLGTKLPEYFITNFVSEMHAQALNLMLSEFPVAYDYELTALCVETLNLKIPWAIFRL